MTRTFRPTHVAAAVAFFASTLAQAQQTPPAAAAAPKADAPAVEQIIVTSQGRREALASVPVAVKAFSAKQIEDEGIKSTQDFINLTPNMSFDNSFTYGNSFVVIRGVSEINNADSPVAVVVDGVPQSDQKQLKMNLVDVARIEVLKGPQGSLYGRNAIGGAIIIDTKRPGNELHGFGNLSVGSGNTREISGGVSGAMVPDKVLFRVVGQTKKSDGLLTNTYLNKKADYIDHDNLLRGRVTVNASEDVTLDFRASSQDYKAGAVWDNLIRDGNLDAHYAPTSSLLGQTQGNTDELTFKADVETRLGTLTAITNDTHLREKYVGDGDFSNPADPLGGVAGSLSRGQGKDRRIHMTSQEVRLTSPSNKPLRWIAGLYYLEKKMNLEEKSFADVNGSVDQYGSAAVTRNNIFTNRASAVFGQIEYDLSRQTKLAGGLRHDQDARVRSDALKGVSVTKTFDAWQPKVTLTHHVDANAIAYATYSTGFRSGGFNTTAADSPIFKSENLRNYEIGYKSSFLDNRLTVNTALFHADDSNFQYFFVRVLPGNILSGRIGNIDKVTLNGLDLDLRFAPAKGLEFDGGVGYTDAKIRQNLAEPGTVGNRAPRSMPWKVNLGGQYTMPIAAGLNGFLRVDVEQRSKQYWLPDNTLVSKSFGLLGARVGLRDAADHWYANLFGRNLTNQHYYADVTEKSYGGWTVPIAAIGSQAPGRVVGIELGVKL